MIQYNFKRNAPENWEMAAASVVMWICGCEKWIVQCVLWIVPWLIKSCIGVVSIVWNEKGALQIYSTMRFSPWERERLIVKKLPCISGHMLCMEKDKSLEHMESLIQHCETGFIRSALYRAILCRKWRYIYLQYWNDIVVFLYMIYKYKTVATYSKLPTCWNLRDYYNTYREMPAQWLNARVVLNWIYYHCIYMGLYIGYCMNMADAFENCA